MLEFIIDYFVRIIVYNSMLIYN